MVDYNFQTSKEIMVVWQKGSGVYIVVRFIEVSPPPPPLKGVQGLTRLYGGRLGSKVQREQGYLKTSQLFLDLWDRRCKLPEESR
jgi:hypothetical protein